MPKYPFVLIDAFTATPLGGNPCPVIFDAETLDPAMRQRLASEMNQSETAFVTRSDVADFGARYYTPAEEIPLAGHPTVSVMTALADAGRIQLGDTPKALRLELRDGPIDVSVARGPVPGTTRVTMTQRKPRFMAAYDPAEIMPCFGLAAEDALTGYPIQTVSTGTPMVMIPVRDHATLRRASLEIHRYTLMRDRSDFFSPHLFCLGGMTAEGDTAARHFGVPPDIREDPVTGSATGAMGAYLWHHGMIERPTFVAEQGHWMGRPGRVDVEVIGPREDIETVKISGLAVVLVRGELTL